MRISTRLAWALSSFALGCSAGGTDVDTTSGDTGTGGTTGASGTSAAAGHGSGGKTSTGGTSGVGGAGGTTAAGAGGNPGEGGSGGSPTGGPGTGGASATAGGAPTTGGSGGVASGGAPACNDGEIECQGNSAMTCANGVFGAPVACPALCLPNIGCAICTPGEGSCAGDMATICAPDGSGTTTTTCPAGTCQDGVCLGPCATVGTGKRTYIGCDYFPTVTSNQGLSPKFSFAAVVGNTTTVTANVQVFQGGNLVAMATVAPNDVATIKLPWVPALKHNIPQILSSGVVKAGAYHLKTDQPVTVYQFNPLEYQIPYFVGCLGGDFVHCYSYTNDASLLLPVNALGIEYIVASHAARTSTSTDMQGNLTVSDIPGFLAITATQDATMVTVTTPAFVRAGTGVKAMSPGDSQTFTLNQGDVVQLFTGSPKASDVSGCQTLSDGTSLCDVPKEFDLTGTRVTSTGGVMVTGGHDCDNIPYGYAACDHLEEVMFPLSAWGNDAIVTPPQSVAGAAANDGTPDQHVVRVISGADGNTITLDPAPPGATIGVLDKGQWADVPLTTLDMHVTGTGPILVAQYMLGGDLVDAKDAGSSSSRGDPSISLAVPVSRYRTEYSFLAPATYAYSFVNVIAPAGANVMLDGAPVGGTPAPVGSTSYTVVRKAVSGAAHHITGDMPFGIIVYGYGSYTSYMYPGGLDLN